MLVAIEGESATGKTTLAYTAPRPAVGFAFDMGIERALFGGKYKELFEGLDIRIVPYDAAKPMAQVEKWGAPGTVPHDITVYELPQPIQLDTIEVKGMVPLWDYFIQLCVEALKDASVRSIVVDTMTVARRVKADAYLEGLQANTKPGAPMRERLIQIEYGATNDAIRSIYTTSAGTKKNLIATHHLTDERKEAVNSKGVVTQMLTGRRILEGLNGTYRFVDVAVRCEKDKDKLASVFQKCGYNLSQEGMPCPDATWDKLCQMIEDSLGGQIRLEKVNGEPGGA